MIKTLTSCKYKLKIVPCKFSEQYIKSTYLSFNSKTWQFSQNFCDQLVYLLLPLCQFPHLLSDKRWMMPKYGNSLLFKPETWKFAPGAILTCWFQIWSLNIAGVNVLKVVACLSPDVPLNDITVSLCKY